MENREAKDQTEGQVEKPKEARAKLLVGQLERAAPVNPPI